MPQIYVNGSMLDPVHYGNVAYDGIVLRNLEYNPVTTEQLAKLRENEKFQEDLELGALTINEEDQILEVPLEETGEALKVSKPVESDVQQEQAKNTQIGQPQTQKKAEQKPQDLELNEALKIVETSNDEMFLKTWLSTETRKTVKSAIEAKLATLAKK